MRLLQRLTVKVGAACRRGATTCMLSTCRGGWPRPGPLQGWLATAWPPTRGRPTMTKAPYEGATGCGQLVGAADYRAAPTRGGPSG
ncbi:hypothetical protein B296_00045217 [Ensete ventricosum]|uniref:Uncharacterized protein n=1 Tax=Ensete ventricosum TaxID=4639 RepID=A0A426X9N6_ENSVE|nr:hypothetical protein B296_00045217 [Ensete ventricosum]